MPNGWGILPRGFLGIVVYGEVTIVQSFYAFVQEGQRLRRDRRFYLNYFLVLSIIRAEYPGGVGNVISCGINSTGSAHAAF